MKLKINITSQYPNQTVSFFADGQNFTLNINWRGYIGLPKEKQAYIDTYVPPCFYADIYIGNVSIFKSLPIVTGQSINQYPSSMVGHIMAINSVDNTNPNLNNLGITVQLYYVTTLGEI
jgi:hypothetical protein